jgi:glycosyltransferase involved in cell wall biosynthesis
MEKNGLNVATIAPRPRIVVVMHSVLNLKFFWVPILESMTKEFDVTLYIRNDAPEILSELDLPCRVVFIPIERKIAPWKDMRALLAIWRQLQLDQPDLLQTVTPKAGLLGMLAGKMVGVPIRVHTFQGQIWATSNGVKREVFRLIDKLIAQLSTTILADSQTQLEFLRNERVLHQDAGRVLGSGSISGVDLVRFNHKQLENPVLRADLGLTDDDFVFIYVGRLQRDKGLHVLADAYDYVRTRANRTTRLIVVGPDEENIGPVLKERLGDAVVVRPYTSRPEDYLRLSDVAVLPSFREGFGSSLIEAAAMGLPAVASRIYGIDCAVVDGKTGYLFEAGNAKEMADAMLRLVEDPLEYKRHSENALNRVKCEFDQKVVIRNLKDYYHSALMNLGNAL